jgi:hypothetical protein
MTRKPPEVIRKKCRRKPVPTPAPTPAPRMPILIPDRDKRQPVEARTNWRRPWDDIAKEELGDRLIRYRGSWWLDGRPEHSVSVIMRAANAGRKRRGLQQILYSVEWGA